MHTIDAPAERWGPPITAPTDRYLPSRPNGKRVPGWEDVNVTLLAADMGCSFRYLLAVLWGQRNCTLSLLQRVAKTLGIELTEVVTRMEKAHRLRMEAAAHPPDKSEKRRERSVRRAISAIERVHVRREQKQ